MEEEQKKPSRKTIYRIKKLLALANDKGATEGEAAEASRRAFALLAKWNLTLDSVEGSSAKEEEPVETVASEKSIYAGGDRWAIGLYRIVSGINECEYSCELNCSITSEKGRKVLGVRHNVTGLHTSVATVHQEAERLLEEVKRVARVAMSQCVFLNENERAKYEYAFRYGCSVRLQQIIREIHKTPPSTYSDTGSNVPAPRSVEMEDYWIKAACDQEQQGHPVTHRRTVKWSPAATDGFCRADSINLWTNTNPPSSSASTR